MTVGATDSQVSPRLGASDLLRSRWVHYESQTSSGPGGSSTRSLRPLKAVKVFYSPSGLHQLHQPSALHHLHPPSGTTSSTSPLGAVESSTLPPPGIQLRNQLDELLHTPCWSPEEEGRRFQAVIENFRH